jgi:gliding motility-associated-like protein
VRRFLLFCICWWGATACFGQFTSRLGRFSVDQVKGCAPFTINMTINSAGECTPGKPCLMDYEGNGTKSTNSFSFTYNTPGTYTLGVLYQSIGSDDITITVVENTDPTFEVYTCTGNKVTLKVTDKKYDTYIIDFNNDNTPEITIPNGNNATAQHDYGAPGCYTIAVRGKNVNAANNCKILTENYQTLVALPQPSITAMTAVDANNLKLDMTTAPHIQYKLEIAINNGGTFQVYKDLYQVNTVTVPNLLVDNNYYCFRLSAFDPCAGTNLYSNTICSQDFDVAFLNGTNDLTWKTSTGGINSVTIMRNNANYSTIPGAPLAFQDSDYNCNENYCYQIIANYAGGVKSTSLSKCGVGKLETTFPAINNVTSVVRDGVELSYKADPTIKIKAFDIMKSMFGQPFVLNAQTSDQLYIDQNYDYAGGTCYQVNYGDFCNNRSAPGIVACPMSLTGIMDDKNAVTLTWNKYTGYNLGVATYQVSKYNKTGGLIGVYPTTDTTFVDYDPADDEQVVIYTITAVANEPGILKSISNNITIEKPVRLILPTAFTPNGDGINPSFSISGKFVSKLSISIFDRWGVLVFTSDKNEPWDGTKAGRPMPESAYVWKAEVVDFAGNSFTKEGTVLLLRPPR